MRSLFQGRLAFCLILACCAAVESQNLPGGQSGSSSGSQSSGPQSSSSQPSSSTSGSNSAPASSAGSAQAPDRSPAARPQAPDLSPPRSDRVNVTDLESGLGQSSSKDSQIDLSAPENDARAHPNSSEAVTDEAARQGSPDSIGEFHPWNPHRAAKDIEVGNYYFNRKNYRAAEDRYREALFYKENDAEATFRLADCLQKMERPGEALEFYESYLKILPSGPHARKAEEAIDFLKTQAKDRAK